MKEFNICSVNTEVLKEIQHKIDFKTKPVGALGQLENTACQIAAIQETLEPQLQKPHVLVFAADHGIANEGVSKYPQEVTYQMVLNFLSGGAAINVFCQQHGIALKVIDAGVKGQFDAHPQLLDQKIAEGTESFLASPAMTLEQCVQAIDQGAKVVTKVHQTGCNVIGFGEMGIGNTTPAAALMHIITKIDLEICVGKGTGLDNEGIQKKLHVLQEALEHHADHLEDIDTTYEAGAAHLLWVLSTFGGFEIAQMVGAFLQAAEHKMVVMVDGFIASSALLVAQALYPQVLEYCVFCHQSDEQGHAKMLEFMKATPLLNLQMRLGEGTGCAVAYPLLQSAIQFVNQMASFESAGVSQS
ncbi:nicotinate-nucleotide--dimethylbenzimidazole phosphoribosyltransferase [uncultured Microscilla sp.]|uniref:nicotinate-nucleotide--dimethylbenzimidazole phosphoribosyltransferase n=1 Tax=uncultured Microscilla sp. TaxID=432653 RepID=UPI00260742D1|nr:nicotinate-nucleotide--dimethylbenzimidazole phosphoribosyltransferase [uncultured Microscilla sp.]